jgi:hypothetical protein
VATLQQDRAELVHERLARCHQARAGSVQGLQVEPVLALQLDEAHGWPRRRLGDPRRIVVVVLLRTDVRPDIFGRHQPDIMSFRGKETADMMGTAAPLHGDGTGWKWTCPAFVESV